MMGVLEPIKGGVVGSDDLKALVRARDYFKYAFDITSADSRTGPIGMDNQTLTNIFSHFHNMANAMIKLQEKLDQKGEDGK